jgi:hypothetical protein
MRLNQAMLMAFALTCAISYHAKAQSKEPIDRILLCGGIGTHDTPELRTVEMDCVVTVKYGYHFEEAYVPPTNGGQWKLEKDAKLVDATAPGGQCTGKVNFSLAESLPTRLRYHYRADQNNGTNCGGMMVFTIPQIPGLPSG